MIQLNKSDFEKMLAHARKELPDEACGLIAGEINGTDKIVKKVYLLTNIDHSNEHFSLDPKEQLEPVRWATGTLIRSRRPDLLRKISGWRMTARQAI